MHREKNRLVPMIALGIALSVICSGCSWFKSKEEKSAQELVAEGMESFESGRYDKAIESFEKLKDWYPFSKYAILAELKLADSYYHRQEYEDAIFAYEEFESLHPRNEAVPYVIYQIGLCYFERIDAIDRDHTQAQKALETFNRLIQQYPQDPYAGRARGHVKACLKNLAMHELYVGIFYYKGKHYKAALSRFRAILTGYPDVGVHYKALQYIEKCETAMLKADEEKK